MTQFPWKIFKGGREIVFPIGARRFISVSVQPISHSGGLRRTIAGSAVWTGHSAFNLHAVSLSCSDQTQAPIFDLWPGDIVQIELPDEFSAPGPSAVLKYDPVPGTVVGVDADDQVVGVQTSASRNVSIPGAVAIRFRPTMNCMVVDRSTSGTQGRQNGQWSLSLEELSGAEDLGGDAVDSVSVDAVEVMSTVAEGAPWSFDVSPYVATTTGLAVSYALLTEQSGLSIDSATGIITWDAVPAGAYAVVFRASSGLLSQEGMVPVYGEKLEVPVVWAEGTGGVVSDYTDSEGKVWRVHTFNAASSFVASKAGAVEALVVGGGGGGGNAGGGGGGAGGVPTRGVVRLNVAPGSHAVTVGAGGAAGGSAFGNRYGRKGSDSSFAGIVGLGGGGGIGGNDNTRGTPDGGSGGGDGASSNAAVYAPGSGIAGQGSAGGLGNDPNTTPFASAGGGGAAEPGFNYNSPTRPASGGNGISSDISGSVKHYAGGGAGVQDTLVRFGGQGGGGNSLQSGQANTGGGGGGGGAGGGAGGSGIVIIRYRIS